MVALESPTGAVEEEGQGVWGIQRLSMWGGEEISTTVQLRVPAVFAGKDNKIYEINAQIH